MLGTLLLAAVAVADAQALHEVRLVLLDERKQIGHQQQATHGNESSGWHWLGHGENEERTTRQ